MSPDGVLPLYNTCYYFVEMRTNRDGSVETDGSALGISTNRAAMIEYAPDASRLKTYNRWPAASPMVSKDLCEAGKSCCTYVITHNVHRKANGISRES